MRILVALTLAGCGRVAFDPASTSDAPATPRQPDLVQLLPTQASNLVGYWRMDGSGADASARGNDLTALDGTVMFAAAGAPVGSRAGMFFDTSFQLTPRPSLEVSYLSYSVWFESDLTFSLNSNSGQTLFRLSCATCGGDPEIDLAYRVELGNDGVVASGAVSLPVASVDANHWHHLVGVYAPTETRLYLDGVLAAQVPAANASLPTMGTILWVGQLWPNRAPLFNPQNLHGAMNELAIWSSVLTDAEARAIYANQHP